MATINNTVNAAGGLARAFAAVSIELLWNTEVSPVAKVPDQDRIIVGQRNIVANEHGYWEAEDIVPNDNIIPAESVYKVMEVAGSNTVEYYISVPDDATPVFWVGDILVGQPEWAE